MGDTQPPAPIIVIKRVRRQHAGGHGGAWKVAFADFVTAMMAFFLLMWLMGAATKKQKAGISRYFKNPSAIQGAGGASTSKIKLGGTHDLPTGVAEKAPTESQLDAAARARDHRRMQKLLSLMKQAIDTNAALKPFKDQILLKITRDGLRIQIVDKKGRPMFAKGGVRLEKYTRKILDAIAQVIVTVPNKISITGHTDRSHYHTRKKGFSNWELSTERANAARRALVAAGVPVSKIGRVVGRASSVLFDKKNPYDPINRRISIIVMTKAAAAALGLGKSD